MENDNHKINLLYPVYVTCHISVAIIENTYIIYKYIDAYIYIYIYK